MSNFTFDNFPSGRYINGMPVFLSNALTITVPAKKTWVDRVLEWNPCNRWHKPPTIEPSDEVYIIGNKIIMHPLHLRAMRDQLDIMKITL